MLSVAVILWFYVDKDGNQFKGTIFRSSGLNTENLTSNTTSKTTPKTRDRLLALINEDNQITREVLSKQLGIGINVVKRNSAEKNHIFPRIHLPLVMITRLEKINPVAKVIPEFWMKHSVSGAFPRSCCGIAKAGES
jgi:hypothetical protein